MRVVAAQKTIPYFQVDAFARQVFRGDPAAVCLLQEWMPDAYMQSIAEENNLSVTAFVILQEDGLCRIRWFTPLTELGLCGHATLAAAHVVLEFVRPEMQSIRFLSSGGNLGVHREADGDRLYLNFPSLGTEPARLPREELMVALGLSEMGDVLRSHYDVLVVLGDEEAVTTLSPRLSELRRFDARGFIVTSVGRSADFVSRFFAPRIGIDEDHVCGSAHSVLVPYWSQRLGKTKLLAKQLTKRGGELYCEDLRNGSVKLGGYTALHARGEIFLPS